MNRVLLNMFSLFIICALVYAPLELQLVQPEHYSRRTIYVETAL